MARVRKSAIQTGPPTGAAEIALRKLGEKRFGQSNTETAEGMADRLYGIPLNGCLPLQYLSGVDIIPVENVLGIVGEPSSGKSTLGWWFLRQYLEYGGYAVFIEVEKKTSWDVVKGLIPESLLGKLQIHQIGDAPTAFNCIQAYTSQYKDVWPNNDIPFVILLDSLGSLTIPAHEKAMDEKGYIDQGFLGAHRANFITENMRAAEKFLWNRPVAFMFINHLKTKMDEGQGNFSPGPPKKSAPGGDHMKYIQSLSFEVSKGAANRTIKTASIHTMYIKMHKTTYGSDTKSIAVDWRIKQKDQKLSVNFDWDGALVDLLAAGKGIDCSDLKDVLGSFSKTSNTNCSCSRLGLSGVSKQELGAAIHADQAIVEALHDVLGVIRKRKIGVRVGQPDPALLEQVDNGQPE